MKNSSKIKSTSSSSPGQDVIKSICDIVPPDIIVPSNLIESTFLSSDTLDQSGHGLSNVSQDKHSLEKFFLSTKPILDSDIKSSKIYSDLLLNDLFDYDLDFPDPKRRKLHSFNENDPCLLFPGSTINSSVSKFGDFQHLCIDPITSIYDTTLKNKIENCSLYEKSEQEIECESLQIRASSENLITFPETSLRDFTIEDNSFFYWIDAWDIGLYLTDNSGSVILFGKIRFLDKNDQHKLYSCSCMIKEIPHILYLLPIANRILDIEESFEKCYLDFKKLANKKGIYEFSSKRVSKRLCFGPYSSFDDLEFLEISYSRKYTTLQIDYMKDSFICVSGSTRSALETLLLYCCIKGPCWLSISNSKVETIEVPSWCSCNISTVGMLNVKTISHQGQIPLFTTMCLCVRYIFNSDLHHAPDICIISYCFSDKMNIDETSITPPQLKRVIHVCRSSIISFNSISESYISNFADKNCYSIIFHQDEKTMLSSILDDIKILDPDFIMGNDTMYYLDMIYHRALFYKLPNTSLLCRIKRISTSSKFTKLPCGRIICDLAHSMRQLKRLDSYDISNLCNQFLKVSHTSFDHSQVKLLLLSSTNEVIDCIENSLEEATLIFQIFNELSIIPLAYQLTSLAGNTLSKTLLGGRAERNDYLLMHAFHSKNFLLPDKIVNREISSKDFNEYTQKKPSFLGGLVFEPKKGIYNDFVLLLDFTSLYPSIIQEYNICFSTAERVEDGSYCCTTRLLKPIGVIPSELNNLVKKRREMRLSMKNLSSNSILFQKYDIRQKALKLTANSIYGCLGYSRSRFYAKSLASMITSLGRDILTNTKEFVETQFGLEIIYGDTDSIMINTRLDHYDKVLLLANDIKNRINELYKVIKIDIDSIFKRLLLLKKKKYAALSLVQQSNGEHICVKEIKGLDIVRRDWCKLAKECGTEIIEIILYGSQDEIFAKIRDYVFEFTCRVHQKIFSSSAFIILKTLTKFPEQYKANNFQPHVRVANWLKQQGERIYVGQVIPFLICNDGTNNSPFQRAYHPDQLKSVIHESFDEIQLEIDIEYYITSQIYPVVSRICAPLVDGNFISEILGGNASVSTFSKFEDEKVGNLSEYYFNCKHCGLKITVISSLSNISFPCSQCKILHFSQDISNFIYLECRKLINNLYLRKFVCNESICSIKTKIYSDIFTDSESLVCLFCCLGNLEILNTLSFFSEKLNYFNCFISEIKDGLVFAESLDFFYEFSGNVTISLSELFS